MGSAASIGTIFEPERGMSDYNIGRVLVINANLATPDKQVRACICRLGRERWGAWGDSQVNDGPPFTPTIGTGGDPLGSKRRRLGLPEPFDHSSVPVTGASRQPQNYVKTECFAVPTAQLRSSLPIASRRRCAPRTQFW